MLPVGICPTNAGQQLLSPMKGEYEGDGLHTYESKTPNVVLLLLN